MSSYIIINYSCSSKRSGAMDLASALIAEHGIKEAKELHGAVALPGWIYSQLCSDGSWLFLWMFPLILLQTSVITRPMVCVSAQRVSPLSAWTRPTASPSN